MKINEVITEIANPYLRGIVKGLTGMEWNPDEKTQLSSQPIENPKLQSTPRPTIPPKIPTTKSTAAVVPSTPTEPLSVPLAGGLPEGVSILATDPLVLQIGKQKYELDDRDQWHPLGSKKTVSPGQAAVLNKYLEML